MHLLRTIGLTSCAVLVVAASASAQGTASAAASNGESLFDGRTLNGWTQVGPGRFVVESDGSIAAEGGTGLIYYTPRTFRDFVLELEYRAESPGANSGIFVRVPEQPKTPQDAVSRGYEIDIDDTGDAIHTTGSISGLAAPARMAAKPAGQWNRYRIEVTGQRYQVFLNGEKVNDFFGEPRTRRVHRSAEPRRGLARALPERARHAASGRRMHRPASASCWPWVDARADPRPDGDRDHRVAPHRGDRRGQAGDGGGRQDDGARRHGDRGRKASRPATLAKYDVLFLANSTLRAAEPDDPVERPEPRKHNKPAPALTQAQEQAMLEFVRVRERARGAHTRRRRLLWLGRLSRDDGRRPVRVAPWTQHVRVERGGARERGGQPPRRRLRSARRDLRPRREPALEQPRPALAGHAERGVEAGHADRHVATTTHLLDQRPTAGAGVRHRAGPLRRRWRNPAFLQHLLAGNAHGGRARPGDFSGHRVKEMIAENVWPDDLAVDERGNVWIAELTGKIHRYDAQTKQTAAGRAAPHDRPDEHRARPLRRRGGPGVLPRRAVRLHLLRGAGDVRQHALALHRRERAIDMATEQVLLRVPTEPHVLPPGGRPGVGSERHALRLHRRHRPELAPAGGRDLPKLRIEAFVERNNLNGYHWSRLVDSERTSQNLQDLRGKILRINKDGTIPKDNPFYGRPGVRWEIYAYGLRNPYRIKWDAQTDRLYIGIVGPDEQTTYDWYDVAQRRRELRLAARQRAALLQRMDPAADPGYVPPMWEYTYAAGGRSATGGPIYRSNGENAFPRCFQEKVFIYDWSRKWIKWASVVNGTFESDTVARTCATDGRQFQDPAKRLANIKTFDVLTEDEPDLDGDRAGRMPVRRRVHRVLGAGAGLERQPLLLGARERSRRHDVGAGGDGAGSGAELGRSSGRLHRPSAATPTSGKWPKTPFMLRLLNRRHSAAASPA